MMYDTNRNRILLLLMTLPFVFACQREDAPEAGTDAVHFSISTRSAETKTVFSTDIDNNKERIDWVVGDKVRIFCPQTTKRRGAGLTGKMYADYTVATVKKNESDDRKSSAGFGDEAGKDKLNFSTSPSHDFYAVYPAPEATANTVTFSMDTTDRNNHTATLQYTLPDVQGAVPNMQYAPMYAVTTGIPDTHAAVPLEFYPAFTVFEITLKVTDHPVDIFSICLRNASGPLSGTYISEVQTGSLVQKGLKSPCDSVALDMSKFADNRFRLEPEETYTVTFLTLPVEHKEVSLWLMLRNKDSQPHIFEKKLELRDPSGEWMHFSPCKKYKIGTINVPVLLDAGGRGDRYDEDVLNWDLPPVTEQVFSVAYERTVRFTTSNLIWDGKKRQFRLAENPLELNYPDPDGDRFHSCARFSWATSGHEKKPWDQGLSAPDSYGPPTWGGGEWNPAENWDWGKRNDIFDAAGLDVVPGLRTLTAEEWEYLLFYRSVWGGPRFAYAVIEENDYISYPHQFTRYAGILIFPDMFMTPDDIVIHYPEGREYQYVPNGGYRWVYGYGHYTMEFFKRLSDMGVVFLPFHDSVLENYNEIFMVDYWSSTSALAEGKENARSVSFQTDRTPELTDFSRNTLQYVRLVQGESKHDPYFTINNTYSALVNPNGDDEWYSERFESNRIIFATSNLQFNADRTFGFSDHPWDYSESEVSGTGVSDRAVRYPVTHFIFGSASADESQGYGYDTNHTAYLPDRFWGGVYDGNADGYPSPPGLYSYNYQVARYPFWDWGTAFGKGKEWFTLSADDWACIFNMKRVAAATLGENKRENRWAYATLNGVKGVILLPDIWTGPGLDLDSSVERPIVLPGVSSSWDDNVFAVEEWEGALEPAGAVFLPAAGERSMDGTLRPVENHSGAAHPRCLYWTSTRSKNHKAKAYRLTIDPDRGTEYQGHDEFLDPDWYPDYYNYQRPLRSGAAVCVDESESDGLNNFRGHAVRLVKLVPIPEDD